MDDAARMRLVERTTDLTDDRQRPIDGERHDGQRAVRELTEVGELDGVSRRTTVGQSCVRRACTHGSRTCDSGRTWMATGRETAPIRCSARPTAPIRAHRPFTRRRCDSVVSGVGRCRRVASPGHGVVGSIAGARSHRRGRPAPRVRREANRRLPTAKHEDRPRDAPRASPRWPRTCELDARNAAAPRNRPRAEPADERGRRPNGRDHR